MPCISPFEVSLLHEATGDREDDWTVDERANQTQWATQIEVVGPIDGDASVDTKWGTGQGFGPIVAGVALPAAGQMVIDVPSVRVPLRVQTSSSITSLKQPLQLLK